MAVTLSVDELRALFRNVVREELGTRSDAKEVLTREEVAEMLSVHPAVVTKYARTRRLPARKIGREYRFMRSEILAWVHAQETVSES